MKFMIGDGEYVEVEITEDDKEALGAIQGQTGRETIEEESAFLRRAIVYLDSRGRKEAAIIGQIPYTGTHFEEAIQAGQNCMRIVSTIYALGYLDHTRPVGEWSLNSCFLRGAGDDNYVVELWPAGHIAAVEVMHDE